MSSWVVLIVLAAAPFVVGVRADDRPASSTNTTSTVAGNREADPTTLRPLMGYLSDELEYSMQNLVGENGTKPYYLGYTVYEDDTGVVVATLGAVTRNERTTSRRLNGASKWLKS